VGPMVNSERDLVIVPENEKLKTYVCFKSLLNCELYLKVSDINKFQKSALAWLRSSSHKLEIKTGRHNDTHRANRKCKFCLSHGLDFIEDEMHFTQGELSGLSREETGLHSITWHSV
jgi:hypothetical protein